MSKETFAGQCVMVTGGAGFIGSSMVRRLLQLKAKVIVYDNFLSGSVQNLKEVIKHIVIVRDDIRSPDIRFLFKRYNVRYVFNLAAEPYIPHCYELPSNFFEINSNGALNIFMSAKDTSVRRIVQYSSSEVYGTAKTVPMSEDHPTLPLSTYAVSKLAADRLAYTLHHEQNIPVVILRQFNCYGPRATQPYVIPEAISQLCRGPDIKLGNIAARRDFTYVDDAVDAALALGLCPKAEGETVNSGYGADYSIEQIVRMIGRIVGHKAIRIHIDKKRLRPLDVQRLQADVRRLKRLVKWRPKVSFEEGLRRTVQYYRSVGQRWLWETHMMAPEDIWSAKNSS